jgi:cytochrome c
MPGPDLIASTPAEIAAPPDQKRRRLLPTTRGKSYAIVALLIALVAWAHWGSGNPVFRSEVSPEPGWDTFRAQYDVDFFGKDGQFVRAVQNGYNLFNYTWKYAPRFTRKTAADKPNACSGCHTVDDLAYGFVNSDRYNAKAGKRISFEEQVQRCYVGSMDGYVPTIYDPAIRDLRLLARAVAHRLQLSEGAVKGAPAVQSNKQSSEEGKKAE